jgi:hypothetical protein
MCRRYSVRGKAILSPMILGPGNRMKQ